MRWRTFEARIPGMGVGIGGGGTRDSRRQRRVSVDLPATLGLRGRHEARVVDVSLVGCLVRSAAALAGGAVIDLQVDLPDGPLRTKVRVAEASLDGASLPAEQPNFLAGLEFLSLGAVEEARLRRFVESESRRRRGANTPPS
jgi:hypothetical protein